MRTQSWGHTAWLKVLSKTPVVKLCPWGLTCRVCLSHSPRVAWLRPAHGQEEYSSGCLPELWAAPACFPETQADPGYMRLLAPKWHPPTPPVSVWDLPPPACGGRGYPATARGLSQQAPGSEACGCAKLGGSLRKLLYIAMLPGACSPRKAQVQTPKAPPWVVHQGLLTLESP